MAQHIKENDMPGQTGKKPPKDDGSGKTAAPTKKTTKKSKKN